MRAAVGVFYSRWQQAGVSPIFAHKTNGVHPIKMPKTKPFGKTTGIGYTHWINEKGEKISAEYWFNDKDDKVQSRRFRDN